MGSLSLKDSYLFWEEFGCSNNNVDQIPEGYRQQPGGLQYGFHGNRGLKSEE
jgi:hypothetical protein